MPDLSYVLADVFTDRPFGGNQLAVFPEAAGIPPATMQAIARELNLAETTFVTAGSAPGRFATRIFTPLAEVPFAGHPTVGTAFVLAATGFVPSGTREIVLEEGVGPVRVELAETGATLFLEGPPKTWPVAATSSEIAEAVGLAPADLVGTPWQASYGLAFLFVTVADQAAVARAALQAAPWARLKTRLQAPDAYVHSILESAPGRAAIHARMFAPDLGVTEDPATGSAAAALAGSLGGITAEAGRVRLTIAQGVEMGRPSRIEAIATVGPDGVGGVSVGGGVVIVGAGRFDRIS